MKQVLVFVFHSDIYSFGSLIVFCFDDYHGGIELRSGG